ncbi:uncharacterized protein M6B38_280155 [Iris pallida]|uniref:Uncharacterized protein n=1 Tax=Iris pallida TaxID=29817 RepID=A0AAX6HZ40_IRIPA|nr:uncharacterized protein M6B38_280155 [Iris pallida]
MATSSSTSPPPSSSSPTSSPDKPPASPSLPLPAPLSLSPCRPPHRHRPPPRLRFPHPLLPSRHRLLVPAQPRRRLSSPLPRRQPPLQYRSRRYQPQSYRIRTRWHTLQTDASAVASAVRTFHPLQRLRPPSRRPRRRAPAAPLRPPVSTSCTLEDRCFQIGPGEVEVGGSRELGGLVSFRRRRGQLRCGVPRAREVVGRKEQLRVRDRARMRWLGGGPGGR